MNRKRRQYPGRIRKMQRHIGGADTGRVWGRAPNRISGYRHPQFPLDTSPFRKIVNQLKEVASYAVDEFRSTAGNMQELQPAQVQPLKYPIVDSDKCTGCGICADICPVNAISIGSVTIINESLCTGCRQCFEACPSGAITFVEEG